MITIIIADDQKLFATSLKSVLENDDKELSVIGIAGNGKEAVDLAGRLKPDLILMDVRMPIMDGVEAVRIIHQRLPEIKIIMLTTYGDDEFVNQAILHGSAGYLLKEMNVCRRWNLCRLKRLALQNYRISESSGLLLMRGFPQIRMQQSIRCPLKSAITTNISAPMLAGNSPEYMPMKALPVQRTTVQSLCACWKIAAKEKLIW